MIFIHYDISIYIAPIWLFSIGMLDYIVGTHTLKNVLANYGLFILIVSFIIFSMIYIFDLDKNMKYINILKILDLFLISFGHIIVGMYYKKQQSI
jgi:hypothetical protein